MAWRAKQEVFVTARSLLATVPSWEYHVHTTWSDGLSSVAMAVAAGVAEGLTRLIFTEHTEPDLVQGGGWFFRYRAEVEEAARRHDGLLEVVAGLEIPVRDLRGTLDADDDLINGVGFVLGAVHAYPGHGWEVRTLAPGRAIELEYQALLGLVDNPRVDAIAHPGGICHHYVTPFPMELFDDVVQKATANGIAIELNPAYQMPMTPYLECCLRHNALISIGSNAHKPQAIGWARRAILASVFELSA